MIIITKVTKSILLKENELLKNKVTELEQEKSSLKIQLDEYKAKVAFFEGIPNQIGVLAGTLWTNFTKEK